MDTDSIAHRVAQGAAFLDKKRPGWAEKIDLDRLMMIYPCHCLLGQLEGNFWSPERWPHVVLGLTYDKAVDLGMALSKGVYTIEMVNADYRRLDDAWKKEIQDRRRSAHVVE